MAVSVKQKAAFIDWAVPAAVEASRRTGVRWQVIVAQWCHETGFGTSDLFLHHRNLAGVKNAGDVRFRGPVKPGTQFRTYASIEESLDDYVRVLSLPNYLKVRFDGTVEQQIAWLGESPWDAGHYRGRSSSNPPGTALLAYLHPIRVYGPLDDMLEVQPPQ